MKKIMLVCAAGMSTSLLVTKMEKKERKGFTFKGIIDKIYIGYK